MSTFVIGLSIGMLLFLIASGVTLIFGVLNITNFGQKSLTEVREKLVERGFDVPESTLPLDAAFNDEDAEDDSDEEVKA